jgi:hypothetical protein
MKSPLEYCAFRFLTQWQEDEKDLSNAISGKPNPDQIRSALSQEGG